MIDFSNGLSIDNNFVHNFVVINNTQEVIVIVFENFVAFR